MNRLKTTLLAALFAGAGVGGAAWAQDQDKAKANTNKGDATQVMPDREDLKPGAAPTLKGMDANAQRQHDRNRDGAATATPGSDSTKTTSAGNTAPATRDWNQIDKNHDNLIQPEEMESWLSQVGPQAAQQKK